MTRRCACGCGEVLTGRRRHARFASEACRLRAWRNGTSDHQAAQDARRSVTAAAPASRPSETVSSGPGGPARVTWPELAAAALRAHPDTAPYAGAWTQGGKQ